MRVVLVTNGLRYGGAERIVEALAEGLVERGDRVHVVATTRDGPVGDLLRRKHIPVSVLSIKSPFDGRVPLKLARVAARFHADVMHSHLAVADIATALAQVFIPKTRIVSTVHSGYVDLGRNARRIWRLLLRRFDRVLAVSTAVERMLPRSIAPAIVRPSLVEEKEERFSREEARRRLNLPSDVKIVMAVGRLAAVKGYDVLASASRHLRTRGVRVLVIGEGPEHDALQKIGGLELLGSRDDASKLMAAADVLVSSSRSEGFPQTPLHAMAVSVPVVATDVGGTSEIVVDEETGLLVAPEDPRALARTS
jgi:glycosyltransferase involved in cell wall biosynthesis